MTRILWTILCSLMLNACLFDQQHELEINSPNGQLSVIVNNSAQGLTYQVQRQGKPVLEPSKLGIVFEDRAFAQNLNIVSKSKISAVNQQYTLYAGKQSQVDYQANQQTLTVENQQKQQLTIIFNVADDGVAFRYRVEGANQTVKFKSELTSFNFDQTTLGWLQPLAQAQSGWGNTNPSYEEHYQMAIKLDTPSPTGAGWVFPALFNSKMQTQETWLAITEADVSSQFHASHLSHVATNGEYVLSPPTPHEVFTNSSHLAQGPLPLLSPWRVIALGSLETLVNSTLGTDLAAPQIAMDTQFIQPGVASWSWGLLKDDFTRFDVQKDFIDHAADMGWQYTLVDADWDRRIGHHNIAKLAQYAQNKNVGLFVWYNSSGNWNTTSYSPKGALLTSEQRNREFAMLKNLGIKGVKIDFFAGDGQSMMAYYHAILQDAAKHQLLVNFHGATLPRGWQRTYPHLLTVEAVKGFEMITFFQDAADKEASHSAVLPFTRNLFDPMDFTPTTFNDIPGIERKTSNALQLAQAVLFTSGLQHIVETPQGMQNVPSQIKQALSHLPANWDESRFITGYPGKHVVIARRAADTWYIAGINGENTSKALTLDLSFIQDQSLQSFTSDGSQRGFSFKTINASDSTNINMMANDGFLLISQ
ncbi:alpha-glucosidase (plasmid) [Saccharobesus litoralis]|uniref:Alpha-glucosidase n=1 Tax=Saccharobesus litoralis TaxID=2172099 RepID=A0A2S0VY74_9ALTE|nr:glycoside hydrolase family 97 protein [Saccharobesus litoralis]AWB69161.1 alpha-glucosidase [Saccharobesus litoralis]